MDDKAHYTLVGAFVLGLGAALVAGVLWLAAGWGGQAPMDSYQAVIRESVSGLNVDAPVKYLGVDVGKVSAIGIDPANPQQVRLRFLIARGTPIRQIIGTADFTFPDNLNFHNHLLQIGVPHQFVAPPGVGHDTLALFNALGEDNWTFYRGVFRICPADLTGDRSVDDADFIGFAAAYNRLDCTDLTMPANCPADLNADDFVDDADFVLFAAAYDTLVCP